jgi:hypothetical protein
MFKPSTIFGRLATTLSIVFIGTAAFACASMESGQSETTTGTVQMALTAVGTDGDTYRLRNATLDIAGPTSASVALDEAWGDSPVFAARVDVGDYTIALEDGWTLQRHNGETFETVAAQMLSPNPASVGVERDATSVVAL